MEENYKNKNKNKKALIAYTVIIAAISLLVALAIYTLTNKKETRTHETHSDSATSALVCTSYNNESAYFKSDIANSVEHVLKMHYTDGKINKMSYEYEGEYNSSDEAKQDSGMMHTNYNIDLGNHGIDHEILTPVFQYEDNTARIKLYLDDYKKMNSAIGKVFYIGSGIIDTIAKNPIEETKKIFENKGFSCIIND